MRIGYLDCFSGISGDMYLGALVDAGVPLELLAMTAAALDIGAQLTARKVTRGGIAATKVDVLTDESSPDQTSAHNHTHDHSHDHGSGHADDNEHGHAHTHEPTPTRTHSHASHRSLSAILKIIDVAPFSDAVKTGSKMAFQLLGQAEAGIHAISVDNVHFHEIGGVDTIVDIVCAAAGCEALGVDRWMSSALNVGSGTVDCAHGTLPVPAPATLALLGNAPIYAAGPPMERITPTGAAILGMLQVKYGTLPPMRVTATGYGAGGREAAGQPNVIRLLVGETDDSDISAEPIAIIETVIDDSTPQLIAYVSELLFDAGAWDVVRTAVQMKKGRCGIQLQVMCSPERVDILRALIFRETTTIGLHWRIENKVALRREWVEVATEWGPVRMKVARDAAGEEVNAAPEYEDCRALAGAHAVPLKLVLQAATLAYAAFNKEKRS